MMKKLIAGLGLASVLVSSLALADNTVVELKTSEGTVVLELFDEQAPTTVRNFVEYVEAGFYDGTVFHRVIDGFMIQGGGFDSNMSQKPTRDPVKNEADNGLKNTTGTVAMARTQAPHSASAQFFINVADNDFLNHTAPDMRGWGYAVFGQVIEGMDVVNKIAKVATGNKAGHQNVPLQAVVIESATLRSGE